MNTTVRLLVFLFTILALAGVMMDHTASAQLLVEIEMTPVVVEPITIGTGPEIIKLLAKTNASNVEYEWKLDGPGEMAGDTKSAGLFYIVPKTIAKSPMFVTVGVTITDGTGNTATAQVERTLVSDKIAEFQIGERVLIKESIHDLVIRQGVEQHEVGTIEKVNFRGQYLIVDFPSEQDWIGLPESVEREFVVGEKVRIKVEIQDPGIRQGVGSKEVGTITQINITEGTLVANFPSEENWIGSPEVVEKVR